MTTTQLLIILGTVWIAPHITKNHGLITGSIVLLATACRELGWL